MFISIEDGSTYSVEDAAEIRTRCRQGEGVIQIAALQSVGSQVLVYLDTETDSLHCWEEPDSGPLEWLKAITEFPGFAVSYTDGTMVQAQRVALTMACERVLGTLAEEARV